ncbi:hypothetical protein [Labrenzia sp. R5_0]|jgi:hypothetical protein|uniref:hypothetical protein n=1 Tax=Labrenzia sp. R5_0 TaxID=2821108 RepID=UPI001ADA7E25|nr:hypothetical protein [Labrenzia sp. R5_0]MBO9459406.1 hypothetical protein [Labrenzia sp. R5_0]
MSFRFSFIFKSVSIALLCGFLAACQTTGLKPGSISSSFAPKGWASKQNGNKAVYVCLPSTCKSPEVVVVGPIEVKGDTESAIRQNLISAELMNAVGNIANVASKGQVRLKTNRRVVTKSYSGFDMTARYRTDKGNVYVAARIIIQNDRGSTVASFATSSSRAKTNLDRFLKQTTIKRLP